MSDDVYDTARNTRTARCGDESMALTRERGQCDSSPMRRIGVEGVCQWESPSPAEREASFLSRLQYHQQEDVG